MMAAQRESRRWPGWLREVGIILGVYLVYWLTRGSLPDKHAIALANGYDVIQWERQLGIFVELDIQSFFLQSSLLVQVANAIYTFLYYPVLIAFAIWAYIQYRERYTLVRNTFVFSAALAFLCFAVFPVAPPRFFTDLGFVDTMVAYGAGIVDYETSGFQAFYNPYAAMPSLHFGWALMVGMATIWIARAWWLKALGALLPIASFAGIVATGNHFVLDAVGALPIMSISFFLAVLFTRVMRKVDIIELIRKRL